MIASTTLLLWLVSSASFGPTDSRLAWTGRVDRHLPGKAILSWSGTSLAFGLTGSEFTLRIRGTKSLYDLEVDGRSLEPLDLGHSEGEHRLRVVLPRQANPHAIAITKRTEPMVGIDTVVGLDVNGRLEKAPALASRKLLFLGNSITCGYGVLDSVKEHPFSHHTEDYTKTYAALVARTFSAQAHALCWSGKGVYRNVAKDTTLTMPVLWERTNPTTGGEWKHQDWQPDLVVIDLGTNDFGRAPAPDPERFHAVYEAFLTRVHAVHPKAPILLVDGPMLNDFWPQLPDGKPVPSLTLVREHLDDLARGMLAKGVDIFRLSLTPNSPERGYGADWHPNQAQQRLNAQEMTEAIRQHLGW